MSALVVELLAALDAFLDVLPPHVVVGLGPLHFLHRPLQWRLFDIVDHGFAPRHREVAKRVGSVAGPIVQRRFLVGA